MSQLEHQFSIKLDGETFDGLTEMGKAARRHYRDQAAVLVERAVRNWVRSGRPADAAKLDADQQAVAA